GPQVDQIVRGLDDIEIVLDDEQRVSRFEELPERGEQLRDVIEMQARGRLVENVEKPFTAVRRQVRRDLDPLSLTTRQRRSRLSQAEVAEADLVEHLQTPQHLWRAAEEGERLSNGEIEHLMDRTSAVAHLEHLRLEPLAVALVAGHEDVREKLHLHAHFAFALTRF